MARMYLDRLVIRHVRKIQNPEAFRHHVIMCDHLDGRLYFLRLFICYVVLSIILSMRIKG